MAVLVTLVNIKKTAMNRGFHKVVLSTTIFSCDLLGRQWNTAATALPIFLVYMVTCR